MKSSFLMARQESYLPTRSDPIASPARPLSLQEKTASWIEDQSIPSVESSLAEVRRVRRSLTRELRQASGLESMIQGLKEQAAPLTPFESSMVRHCSKAAGMPAPTQVLHVGIEGFEGPRFRALCGVGIESASGFLRSLVDHIVALWKRFVAAVKALYHRWSRQFETSETYWHDYAKSFGKAVVAKGPKVDQATADKATELLSIRGRFAPDEVLANHLQVTEGIGGPAFRNTVSLYLETCRRIADVVAANGADIQTVLDGASILPRLKIDGFEPLPKQKASIEHSEVFASKPLVGGRTLLYRGFDPEFVSSASSTDPAGIFTALGSVSRLPMLTLSAPLERPEEDLLTFGRQAIEGCVAGLQKLARESKELSDYSDFTDRYAKKISGAMEKLQKASTASGTDNVNDIVGMVIKAVNASGRMVLELSSDILGLNAKLDKTFVVILSSRVL